MNEYLFNNDEDYIRQIMQQHSNNFELAVSDMGETVYEWIEDDVKNLSSQRLASILQALEQEELDQQYRQVVEQELVARDHYRAAQTWQPLLG